MAGALHELLLQVSNLFLTICQLATGRLQLLVQVPNLVVPHLYFLVQRLDLLVPVPANDGLPLQLSQGVVEPGLEGSGYYLNSIMFASYNHGSLKKLCVKQARKHDFASVVSTVPTVVSYQNESFSSKGELPCLPPSSLEL